MTLEFVVITTGRFGSVERTLIITEPLHAKVLRRVSLAAADIFAYPYKFLC